jgi:hypothetical protein
MAAPMLTVQSAEDVPSTRPTMLEHRVDHGQQFPDTGNEWHCLGFSHPAQVLIDHPFLL